MQKFKIVKEEMNESAENLDEEYKQVIKTEDPWNPLSPGGVTYNDDDECTVLPLSQQNPKSEASQKELFLLSKYKEDSELIDESSDEFFHEIFQGIKLRSKEYLTKSGYLFKLNLKKYMNNDKFSNKKEKYVLAW